MEDLNNNPIQENDGEQKNSRSGFGSQQTNGEQSNNQQYYNNYQENYNEANKKKKSKAPIIIIIVIIAVLLLGCCGTGIFFGVNYLINEVNNEVNYESNNRINKINEINSKVNKINNSIKNNTITNSTKNNVVSNSIKNNVVANNTVTDNTVNNNVTTGDAKTSTKEAPLSKGEWGVASKYSTKISGYSPVNVKVTKFTRGEEAQKIVDDYKNNNSTIYKFETPNAGLEWLVIDYDVDFSNYEMNTLGANADVSGDVEGLTSSSIKYNGTTYITSTIYIGSRDYVKTNTATGRIVTQVPVGCKDYVVKFGAYNETNAYFKGE